MRALPTSSCELPDRGEVRSPSPVRLGTVKSIQCVRRNLATTRPPDGRDARVGARVLRVVRGAGKQRRPRRVTDRPLVAVGVAGADRRHRPPEGVVVLGVEAGDQGVGVRHRDHRHEPRGLHDVELVVEDELAERTACLLDRSFTPEPRRQRLLGGPRRARAAADLLDLVVVPRPSSCCAGRGDRPAGTGRRSRRLNGSHQAEVRPDRRRPGRDPHAGDRRVRRRCRSPASRKPSSARRAMSWAATSSPVATPSVLGLTVVDGQQRRGVRRARRSRPAPGGSAPGWRGRRRRRPPRPMRPPVRRGPRRRARSRPRSPSPSRTRRSPRRRRSCAPRRASARRR